MWVNVGDQQFHLPQGKAQHFRGTIGLMVPDLDKLRWRLDQVGRSLTETEFSWRESDDYIEVTCPWGNRLRCHAPDDNHDARHALSRHGRTCGFGRRHRELLSRRVRNAGHLRQRRR